MTEKGQVSHGKKTLALKCKCPCMLCETYRERVRAQHRASYRRCEKPDRSEYQRNYYQAHKEGYRQYYEEHRERYLAHFRRSYQEDREGYDAKKRKRRALRNGALGTWSITEAEHDENLHQLQEGCCFYCGEEYGGNFHREHRIPLSRGGFHAPDNVVLSCATCNLRKGNKTEEEYQKFLDIKIPA